MSFECILPFNVKVKYETYKHGATKTYHEDLALTPICAALAFIQPMQTCLLGGRKTGLDPQTMTSWHKQHHNRTQAQVWTCDDANLSETSAFRLKGTGVAKVQTQQPELGGLDSRSLPQIQDLRHKPVGPIP